MTSALICRRSLAALLCALLAIHGVRAEEENDTPPQKTPKPVVKSNPIKAEKPIPLPEGDTRKAWELLVKNDFAAAEKEFGELLKKNPKDLLALEGLRAAYIAVGNYKESQIINLKMVELSADSPLCSVFASRAMDALPFVESRTAMIESFAKTAAAANPSVAAMLKDNLASLYFRANKTAEGRKALENLGYVEKWLFIAGPFGSKDRNNPIEKRFAPERSLKALKFEDENGKEVPLHKDVKVAHRDLELDPLFPGARGIFYAFTNIESESDQEVIIGTVAMPPYKLFLRGLPLAQEPDEDSIPRQNGELIHTRLVKGSNPLLLKLSAASSVTVRLMNADLSPAKGVQIKALDEQGLAAHSVSSAQGFLFSEKAVGSTAEYFLKKFPAVKAEDDNSNRGRLKAIAQAGVLNLAETAWFDLALQRENNSVARVTLAHAVSNSFPDSVAVLDLSASILQSAGTAMGNSDAREADEAQQNREHALSVMPKSHQHLIAQHHAAIRRNLDDQAFEKIKTCVDAFPNSPLAQAEMAAMYQKKQFVVEAEKCFEKAAELDSAFLPRLVFFHDTVGNKARARELRKKQVELGMLDADTQFDIAVRRGEFAEAEKILSEQEAAYPERKDELSGNRVRLLIEKGDQAAAYALQKKLYELPRFQANKRAVLINLLDLALRLNKDDEAKQYLQTFLKENPGDLELQQRLSDLNGTPAAHWWDPYDVNVREIDTSAFTNAKYPEANHAWIVDFMVTKILPDLSTESYVHIAQKVLNLQGINELSELLVGAQKQDIVYVRTLNPDGSVFMPQNVHDFNLARSASLYKVGPGSILEHAYLMRTRGEEDIAFFNMGFNFNAIDAPRAVSRWVVMIPDEAKALLDIRKIRGEMIDEKILKGPPGYTVYQWTNKQVEGIKREPLMPLENDQEVIPLVMIDNPDVPFRANGWLMRREKNEIPEEAISEAKRLGASTVFKKLDDGRKFDAIVSWVRANIQTGNDSRTLSDVWFSRSGRPDQMTSLAREMCVAAGLQVRIAHVNGAYIPGRMWRSKYARNPWEPAELANFGSGGRMLVLEQPVGVDRWAQFVGRSPRHFWPNDLNYGQGGALALTTGDDGLRIKRVRGEMLGMTFSSQKLDVSLDKAGVGSVTGKLQLFGNAGGNFREALTDPRQTNQIRDWVVRYAWPKGQVTDFKVMGEDQPEMPLTFVYTCTVKGLGAPAGDSVFITPFLTRPRILELRGPPERENDLLLKEEVAELDHTLTYIAPEGYAWTEVPEDLFLVTEFGFFLVDYNVKGRTLTCTRSYLMPQQRITPEKYPRMIDFISQITSSAQQRVAYAPVNAKSFGGFMREIYSTGYASFGENKSNSKLKKPEPKPAPKNN